jgi:hypothetical protein
MDEGGSVVASASSALIELNIRCIHTQRGTVELVPQLVGKVFDEQISS